MAYHVSSLAVALSLDTLGAMGTAGVFVSATSSLFHRAAAKSSLLHGTAGLSSGASVFLIRADFTALNLLWLSFLGENGRDRLKGKKIQENDFCLTI